MKQNHSMMSIIFAILTCFIITIPMCGQSIATECYVLRVIDGDTAVCGGLRIRLADIDAPEKKQPYGKDATNMLSNLINNKIVDYDSNKRDMYGRIIARLYYKDIDVSLYMVKSGAAWAYMTKDKEILNAEKCAREQRIGLWHDDKPKAPWLYRKGK